jgi:hypothetical protein
MTPRQRARIADGAWTAARADGTIQDAAHWFAVTHASLERYTNDGTADDTKLACGLRQAVAAVHDLPHGLPRPDQTCRTRQVERGIARLHGAREVGATPVLHAGGETRS